MVFCTEGCTDCSRKAGDPAPAFEDNDFDDAWDAQTVLIEILGPPPANEVVQRWKFDPEKNKNVLLMVLELESATPPETELKSA